MKRKKSERFIRRIDHVLNQIIDYVGRVVLATPPDAVPAATAHLNPEMHWPRPILSGAS